MRKLAPRARGCAAAATGLGPEDTSRFIELHDTYAEAGMEPMDAARKAAADLVAEIKAEAADLTKLIGGLLPAKAAPAETRSAAPGAAEEDRAGRQSDDGRQARSEQADVRADVSEEGLTAPLYASRPVTNAADIIAWAAAQGFTSTLPAKDLHVTVAYSREPVNGGAVRQTGAAVSVAGGKRTVEPLGDEGAVVLKFASDELQARWKQYREAGASWDYDSYTPHVTLTYDGKGVDLSKVAPYAGPIELGAEKQEALNEDKADDYKATEKPTLTAPMADAPLAAEPAKETAPEVEQAPAQAEPVKADGKIDDVGEKIGGARKDTSVSTGPSRKRATDDERPAWARRFDISQIVTPGGQINEVRDAGRWIIRDKKSLDWMGQAKQVGRSTYATEAEAEAFVPIAAVGMKHRVVMASTKRGDPDKYEIWRDITDRKRVKVVERQFDSREDALAYMLANAVEIIETNTTFGEGDLPLPPDRARTGPQRRDGNVVGDDFKAAFGFRGVEFGNWNNQDERQALMNDAWDGLMDLADVLAVPPKALGLNGDLALAFGARGQGLQSARAHYENQRAVINLTKEKGAGSLAHEFFHGLDHYFGRQDGKASAKWVVQPDGTRTLAAKGGEADFLSGGSMGNRSGVRPELRAAYEKLLTTMFKKAEGYVEDTAKADKFTGTAREELATALDKLRADLSEQKDVRYWKRNNKPASAEVLAEFDTIAAKMVAGETLETDWRIITKGGDKPAARAAIASRWTNDSLERLGALYKEVRGRTGFNAEKSGVMDRLRGDMTRYSQRLKMLADAQSGTEKTKMVPTNFAMNAKELDQGRGTDYWTTPHEMAARAFQGYVEDKIAERGGVSRFLNYAPANIVIPTPWGFKRPYPAGAEREAINKAFDAFVAELKTREDDAGNVALFAKGRATDTPSTLKSARAEIASLFGDSANGVVTVAATVDDLPPKIAKIMREAGATGMTLDKQHIYIVADLVPQGAVRGLVMHELGVHIGMDRPTVAKLTEQVMRWSQGTGTLADQAKWSIKAAANSASTNTDEESLAYMVQVLVDSGVSPNTGPPSVRRFMAAIVRAFKAAARALGLDVTMTPQDMVDYAFGAAKMALVRRGAQTEAAQFSQRDPSNADIRFSRSIGATITSIRNIDQQKVRNTLADLLGGGGAKVSWWDKTLGTQYAKAEKHPAFKRVFEHVQNYIEDVSSLANEAADAAPGILPKLEKWQDLRKFGIEAKDAQAIAAPVFEGTLTYARDQGKLVKIDDLTASAAKISIDAKARRLLADGHFSEGQLKAWRASPLDVHDKAVENRYEQEYLRPGAVFTPEELRSVFKLTDAQIGQYQQFRAAVDQSLDQVAAAEALRLMGDVPAELRQIAMTDRAKLRQAIEQQIGETNNDLWNDIADRYNKVDRLKKQGYAPLMRFGKFKVHVVDAAGETQFFGLYETKGEANRMARELAGDPEFAGMRFERGVLSQEAHKLFSSVPVESLEMFADALGADKAEVYQQYLRLAKNNRSALKRLIHRKGTAGFSDDVPRVLASFVTSNARLAASAMNLPQAKQASQDIRDGDVQDEAVKLVETVQNPVEAASSIRALMFMNFIGGSIASAVVNVTQPVTMTLPYLTQYGGAAKALARLLSAAKQAAGKPATAAIAEALKRAERDGIVSPQEIHHLQAQAMATWGQNPWVKRAAFIWGAPFSLAEQWNRRVSFIAAYQTAQQEGIADPFEFAEKAVVETQGLYNKGNAPNLARTAPGALALQFKQYGIHYIEWLGRMWNAGAPGSKERADGRRAVLIALALLMVFGGADGLPFADDIDDLADTLTQALGFDAGFKKGRREFVSKTLGMGDLAADVFSRGLSSIPGVPMDVSLRMGMGNLLPATGILLRSNTDRSRDVLEIAGPAGGLAKQYLDAAQKGLRGDAAGAAIGAMPMAAQNIAKAMQMWSTGEARDTKDRLVMKADELDGVMKFLGFNPAEIARESQRMGMIRRTEQLAKNVEGDIVERWARGYADREPDAVKEAKEQLAEWNRDNPTTPIRITMRQVRQRAAKMRASRAERFTKSVSPERRAATAAAL